MSQFDKQVKDLAEKAILKIFKEGNWVKPDFNNRVQLDSDFMQEAWGMVDKDKIREQLKILLEKELAQRIVNHMAAEIGTDVKKVLNREGIRERIRTVVEDNFKDLMKDEK